MHSDLGVLYRASRLRVTQLVSDAVDEVTVPATPLWSVHDVIAHLAGITEDVASGNMQGVTTDPWTAAQVERGRERSLAELLAMWQQYAPGVEGFLSSPNGTSAYQAVLDIHTHEADLLNALGQPIDLSREFLDWIQPVLEHDFHQAVARSGLPRVQVTASNLQWFRGRLGRRTEAEVKAYDWSQTPEPYLDTWFIFGRAQTSLGETWTTEAA
jgi:uncharacterized protein (TIGR03083 family)